MNLKIRVAAFALSAAIGSSAVVHAQAVVCPVTKLSIPSAQVAVGKSVYKRKTYYFCTSNCKTLFDKNPAKFAAKARR